MTRPPWEVADIIRRSGNKFFESYRDLLTCTQLKVLRAIERCRTAALVGIAIDALAAAIRPSLTTRAETGACPLLSLNAKVKDAESKAL